MYVCMDVAMYALMNVAMYVHANVAMLYGYNHVYMDVCSLQHLIQAKYSKLLPPGPVKGMIIHVCGRMLRTSAN